MIVTRTPVLRCAVGLVVRAIARGDGLSKMQPPAVCVLTGGTMGSGSIGVMVDGSTGLWPTLTKLASATLLKADEHVSPWYPVQSHRLGTSVRSRRLRIGWRMRGG